MKYLGITLDRRLNWNMHLQRQVERTSIALGQCCRAVGKTWGLTPKTAMWIYTAVIRPMILYGTIVWWPAVRFTSKAAKLQQLQRIACLMITGAMSSSPTIALENMLNLPPLDIYVEQVAMTALLRLQQASSDQKKVAELRACELWRRAASEQPLLESHTDLIPPKFCYNRPYGLELQSPSSRANKTLSVYTDGSKTVGGSGAGIFSHDLQLNLWIPLGMHATVHQAELIAIANAAYAIANSPKTGKEISIYTDSRQAILALGRHRFVSGVVMDCHNALTEASRRNHVKVCWIKGHSEVRGNNKADRLARRAARRTPSSPEPVVAPTIKTQVELIKRITHQRFCDRWDKTPERLHAREMLRYPNEKTTIQLMELSKRDLRLLTHFWTGHCKLNKHKFVMKLCNSPICRACEHEEESVSHIMFECPVLANLREFTLGEAWPTASQLRNSPPGALLTFVKNLGWFEAQEE